MGGLVFLPALLIDQSFPRTEAELDSVSEALVAITKAAAAGELVIGLTDAFDDFISGFNWIEERAAPRFELYRLLDQLRLQPGPSVVRVPTQSLASVGYLHPVPEGVDVSSGDIEYWREDLGRVIRLQHEACFSGAAVSSCAGIACPWAFSGKALVDYPIAESLIRFRIVGPSTVGDLAPLYAVNPRSANAYNLAVSVRDVMSNYRAIGALDVVRTRDHLALEFPSGAKWVFDEKWGANIGDNALKELQQYTGFALPVIKESLASGARPVATQLSCIPIGRV